MIPRYETEAMRKIFSDEEKYQKWLDVEIAVLHALADFGEIPAEVPFDVRERASFNVKRIEELDEDIHHDFLAFLTNVRESLSTDLGKRLHDRTTTFDTEEPATSLILIAAMAEILESLDQLIGVINLKADEYRDLKKIFRTHGQQAEPGTQGLEFLGWANALKRQFKFLEAAIAEMHYSKISGATGTYPGGLSPELEKKALEYLGLKPASFSSQIILRDRHAHVINALAVLAGVIEHIALNIRLLSQTEVGELQEPFGKKQKGSSRMAHKRNPIKSENLCGLARLVRNNAGAALENIATWGARDISHSSVERVIFADCFHLVHFMILRLTGIMAGIVVHEDRMKENLNLLRGVIFSPEVRELLVDNGMDPDTAYEITQELSFKAIDEKSNFLLVLLASDRIPGELKVEKIPAIFNISNKLKNIDAIFIRNGLPRKEREA